MNQASRVDAAAYTCDRNGNLLWSGDDLLAEYAGNGTLKRRYLHGVAGYTPLQVHHIAGTTTTAYDVRTDHLDTPRLLTNSTGAAVWTSRHRAFGEVHVQTDPDGDGTDLVFPFRFPGQYEDPETGLHYNWHRYYDPHAGRYLSTDPLGQRWALEESREGSVQQAPERQSFLDFLVFAIIDFTISEKEKSCPP